MKAVGIHLQMFSFNLFLVSFMAMILMDVMFVGLDCKQQMISAYILRSVISLSLSPLLFLNEELWTQSKKLSLRRQD